MCLCSGGGRRIDTRIGDLRNRTFIVANSEEFAKLSLARRNNSTTIISTKILVQIDAQDSAPSHGEGKIIDVPQFCPF